MTKEKFIADFPFLQEKSKYYKKQFSILGDSISTLEGYNPSGYKVFYTEENSKKSGVTHIQDTWWGKVISYFGGELLINNSWSGSRVTKFPDSEAVFPAGCSKERTSTLHRENIRPDVIIVYLGFNDWANGVKTGNETRILTEEDSDLFDLAYDNMLNQIKSNYPKSEIWCCTLCETYISRRPDFIFPHRHAGIHIEEYNDIIRKVVQKNGCNLMDLYSYKTPYDSMDGSHPTSDGMDTIAKMVIRSMQNKDNSEYVMLDPDMTMILYPNILKLTIENTSETVEFRKNEIHAGRYSENDLLLTDKMIARWHATFFFENNTWYLRDNSSTNGTWLNNVRMISGKKYQLQADDVINFAMAEKVIFYKSKSAGQSKGDIAKVNISDIKKIEDKTETKDKYIGTTVAGRYSVIRLLGKGAFSKTYLVEHLRLKKRWTMKICDKKSERYKSYFGDAILKELNIVKRLNHPNIPVVVEIFEDSDSLFIIREFIEGLSLKEVLNNYGAQPEEQVIEWAKELCDMLAYLHNQTPPHIYRDMKPANLILMKNGHLKVVDFGTVRMYDKNKKEDTCWLGTKGYAAPEQFCGRTDTRTDIYGLGMTIHHLVTGYDPNEPPYEVKPICEINPSLSKGLEYIISKCIEVNPDNRYQSAIELLEDLNNYKNLPKPKSLLRRLFRRK